LDAPGGFKELEGHDSLHKGFDITFIAGVGLGNEVSGEGAAFEDCGDLLEKFQY
jgi:hypothetical protein